MTKLLFVVHDDVADAVPACKDAGRGGKRHGVTFLRCAGVFKESGCKMLF